MRMDAAQSAQIARPACHTHSPGVAADGGKQLQVLPHRQLRPQHIKLGAHPQAGADGGQVAQNGQRA